MAALNASSSGIKSVPLRVTWSAAAVELPAAGQKETAAMATIKLALDDLNDGSVESIAPRIAGPATFADERPRRPRMRKEDAYAGGGSKLAIQLPGFDKEVRLREPRPRCCPGSGHRSEGDIATV